MDYEMFRQELQSLRLASITLSSGQGQACQGQGEQGQEEWLLVMRQQLSVFLGPMRQPIPAVMLLLRPRDGTYFITVLAKTWESGRFKDKQEVLDKLTQIFGRHHDQHGDGIGHSGLLPCLGRNVIERTASVDHHKFSDQCVMLMPGGTDSTTCRHCLSESLPVKKEVEEGHDPENHTDPDAGTEFECHFKMTSNDSDQCQEDESMLDLVMTTPSDLEDVMFSNLSEDQDSDDKSCNKSPIRFNNLTAHSCRLCPKRFRSKTAFKRHLKEAHDCKEEQGAEEVHRCLHCGQEFSKASLLREHDAKVHSTDPKHQCQLCPYRGLNLKAHMLTHSDLKLFCQVCGKGVRSAASLKRHMEQHPEEAAKLYGNIDKTCSVCGKVNASREAQYMHWIREHSTDPKYQCPHCPYRGKPSKLAEHIATHSRPQHVCAVCGKQFKSKLGLEDHNRLHFDSEVIKCKLCDYTSKTKSSMASHMRYVHQGKKRIRYSRIKAKKAKEAAKLLADQRNEIEEQVLKQQAKTESLNSNCEYREITHSI